MMYWHSEKPHKQPKYKFIIPQEYQQMKLIRSELSQNKSPISDEKVCCNKQMVEFIQKNGDICEGGSSPKNIPIQQVEELINKTMTDLTIILQSLLSEKQELNKLQIQYREALSTAKSEALKLNETIQNFQQTNKLLLEEIFGAQYLQTFQKFNLNPYAAEDIQNILSYRKQIGYRFDHKQNASSPSHKHSRYYSSIPLLNNDLSSEIETKIPASFASEKLTNESRWALNYKRKQTNPQKKRKTSLIYATPYKSTSVRKIIK